MKKLLDYGLPGLAGVLGILYTVLVADSFYCEYWSDNFIYWGYPQWGWMYADSKVYFWFNVFYLSFLFLALVIGFVAWVKKYFRTAGIVLLLPLLSAAVFGYMPTYNWNQQFEIFTSEKNGANSRVPEGKWWVSASQMQRYDDVSVWEKAKGWFGRGEWPGGYAIWGEYRIWLLPDLSTDTLGRRGMVIHGGTKGGSPWGLDMSKDIIDIAMRLRRNQGPLDLNVKYNNAAKSVENTMEATEKSE